MWSHEIPWTHKKTEKCRKTLIADSCRSYSSKSELK